MTDNNAPVFDFERLEEITAGDAEFTHELVSEFLDNTPDALDCLEASIADGNCAQVQLEAHGLKGSCYSLGAQRMGLVAQILETMAHDGNLAGAEAVLAAIRQAWTEVDHVLRSHLTRLAA